ncbi:MAG: DUF4124 domain-containing protein [Archangium sp.]
MLLALAVSVLLGQATTYEWVDEKGETHFTDDVSTVPKRAKVKTTTGGDLSVIEREPKNAPPQPPKKDKPTWDTCEVAKRRLDVALAKLEEAKKKFELEQLRYEGKCAEIASRFGAEEEARCLKRGRKAVAAPTPKYSALQTEVDRQQDELRRAQVSGCSL